MTFGKRRKSYLLDFVLVAGFATLGVIIAIAVWGSSRKVVATNEGAGRHVLNATAFYNTNMHEGTIHADGRLVAIVRRGLNTNELIVRAGHELDKLDGDVDVLSIIEQPGWIKLVADQRVQIKGLPVGGQEMVSTVVRIRAGGKEANCKVFAGTKKQANALLMYCEE